MTDTYIVTGGRSFGDLSDKSLQTGSAEYHQRFLEYKWAAKQLTDFFKLDVVFKDDIRLVMGDASGIDNIARQFCISHSIPHKVYKAEWSKYYAKGKPNPAGPIRNRQMVTDNLSAKGILIFPGGKGTKNCASIASEFGIRSIRFEYANAG